MISKASGKPAFESRDFQGNPVPAKEVRRTWVNGQPEVFEFVWCSGAPLNDNSSNIRNGGSARMDAVKRRRLVVGIVDDVLMRITDDQQHRFSERDGCAADSVD